jgi:hypothetical protein
MGVKEVSSTLHVVLVLPKLIGQVKEMLGQFVSIGMARTPS